MNKRQVTIWLRISHPSWRADVFTKKLKLLPWSSCSAGEQRVTPTGVKLKGKYPNTCWYYCFVEDRHIDDTSIVVDQLLDKLHDKTAFLKKILKSKGRLEVIVSIVSPVDFAETFPKEVIFKMGKLGIELSFDVYLGDPDKPASSATQ
jgi:hypothetical protein